jgi:hypothetical protein
MVPSAVNSNTFSIALRSGFNGGGLTSVALDDSSICTIALSALLNSVRFLFRHLFPPFNPPVPPLAVLPKSDRDTKGLMSDAEVVQRLFRRRRRDEELRRESKGVLIINFALKRRRGRWNPNISFRNVALTGINASAQTPCSVIPTPPNFGTHPCCVRGYFINIMPTMHVILSQPLIIQTNYFTRHWYPENHKRDFNPRSNLLIIPVFSRILKSAPIQDSSRFVHSLDSNNIPYKLN